ncbi:MAG: cyclic pyranopterin monophosphate synthase MoaC [Candidatus Coatesbacteria bacterium]|nr:cyclic pyranopterin monophosphate synthase MoaC [Candidatus Coatesbacteria bacterium]
MTAEFSHTDDKGRARMVDVSGKPPMLRIARAEGRIDLLSETVELIAKNKMKKGGVLATAEIAGIQAAKKTFELIPLCHPLPITKVEVKAELLDDGVRVESQVSCIARTGIEMEALTAVSVALLTVYDMCKAVDKNMRIGDIVVLEKIKRELDQTGKVAE